MPVLEKRVSRLEEVFERFIYEMQEFKDEMKEFKEEMRLWRDKTDKTIQQLIEDRKKADERWEKEKKEMNKRWGELANKMGTIVEDIVAPNIPTVAKKYFGIDDILSFALNFKKKNKKTNQIKEFDVILEGEESVILNETKSTVKMDYVNNFIEFIKSNSFFDYFPEYRSKKLIPIFSSLYIEENIVNYLSSNNIYAMALKGDSMDILNPEIKV